MLNFENLDKANFLGVGKYDTPIIQPEHIDVRHLEWIPFNFAKTCTDCATNGKPFVNSFGEATKREITTTSYKNSQARLDKEIMRFVGGEINRKKQTKRRK